MDSPAVAEEMPSVGIDATTPMPQPLAPAWLAASLVAIAVAAVLFCCLVAVLSTLGLFASFGTDGATDFLQQLKFDRQLRTQVGAATVSAAYVGLALATLAAAWLRGGRGWRDLVALRPMRSGRTAWRDTLGIAALTLGYIAVTTYAAEHARDRSLLVTGPTDMVLISLLVGNLVVLAPIAEELVFRGWIYTALRRSFSFWPSYLVTIALFAGIHWDASHIRIVQVLPLSAALGLMRERAGSIKPTIALHATYNLVIVAIRLAFT
jgi:membrane protease YdiL (CAAX protease family)